MKEKSWEKLHIEKDQEPFGVGSEKKVYQDKENPDRVIGKYYPDVGEHGGFEIKDYEVKGRYYLTKILHLLFPKNIPDIHLAAMKPNISVRKKVKLGPSSTTLRKHYLKELSDPYDAVIDKKIIEAKAALTEDPRVEELFKKIVNLGLFIDGSPQNFGIDKQGNIQYVEDFQAFHWQASIHKVGFNEEKLEEAIMKLPEKEHGQAAKYLERLKDLEKQMQEDVKKNKI